MRYKRLVNYVIYQSLIPHTKIIKRYNFCYSRFAWRFCESEVFIQFTGSHLPMTSCTQSKLDLKLEFSNATWNFNTNREITSKKIPCYMRDLACRWYTVKKTKIFWSYFKHFWILPVVRNCRIVIGLCK